MKKIRSKKTDAHFMQEILNKMFENGEKINKLSFFTKALHLEVSSNTRVLKKTWILKCFGYRVFDADL